MLIQMIEELALNRIQRLIFLLPLRNLTKNKTDTLISIFKQFEVISQASDSNIQGEIVIENKSDLEKAINLTDRMLSNIGVTKSTSMKVYYNARYLSGQRPELSE